MYRRLSRRCCSSSVIRPATPEFGSDDDRLVLVGLDSEKCRTEIGENSSLIDDGKKCNMEKNLVSEKNQTDDSSPLVQIMIQTYTKVNCGLFEK
ncbi:hypothetical protein DOY81_000334 [Sarcophaga bullata]|nr:hypothetical protein DOY81_000334 [Sarcophaga bullata]